ncbi:hypothetical protein M3175_07820 [Robertmurraya korlensis]|uniref:hypothetical protein n=1 Tax=Robertmurraya korlensis TaxID=519977 RepID=UPI00203F6538|nr:hypothetical protein [Robertmurraya korlensis]MCM3600635.1 hypothetical protein [Robertmurraya korlensis]
MRLAVITAFIDKNTHIGYSVGDTFESDDSERVSFLQDEGYLFKDDEEENPEAIKHVGGGYYELPNGEKVKGKDNALKALEELEESPPIE